MKIFVDSGNINEIERVKKYGIVDGITTNPTLLARENTTYDELMSHSFGIPIHLELLTETAEDMIRETDELIKQITVNKTVIKVPITKDGLEVMNYIASTNFKSNATLVFTPLQALLAAKAGADYVSIFVGRLDDNKNDTHQGMKIVDKTLETFKKYDIKTEIIVASVRGVTHIRQAMSRGVHIITVPPKFIDEMIYHSLTETGVEQFMSDWRKVNE